MSPQDVLNISQWLQQILKDLQDTHIQTQDMRSELKAVTQQVSATAGRVDQKDSEILRLIDTLRGSMDVVQNAVHTNGDKIDARVSRLESEIKELKTLLHEIRRHL